MDEQSGELDKGGRRSPEVRAETACVATGASWWPGLRAFPEAEGSWLATHCSFSQ